MAGAGAAIEIVPITTSGDRIQDRPLAEVGGKALWTKELDRCLLDGRTDLSVHSMKDVETIRPDALAIAAMLPRADVRDRLVGAESLDALAARARGSAPPRRAGAAQLLARRPDLDIVADPRQCRRPGSRKLETGEADATLLAAAGLDRLGLGDVGTADRRHAAGAGAGRDRGRDAARPAEMRALVAAIDDRPTHRCVAAERGLLAALGGDCRSPVAAHARMSRASGSGCAPRS